MTIPGSIAMKLQTALLSIDYLLRLAWQALRCLAEPLQSIIWSHRSPNWVPRGGYVVLFGNCEASQLFNVFLPRIPFNDLA